MKVFVSHSMKDQSILDGIRNPLKAHGIELLLAEHEIDLKNSTTDKIKKMIESCHLGLILLTKEGLKSGFVREEIGYLEAKQKPSLIIFEKGVKKMYGGFKFGCDNVELDPNFPEKAVESVNQILIKMRKFFIFLLLGPSSLVAQKVDLSPISTTGQIIKHKYYTLSYSKQNKQAEWVFYLLTKKNSLGAVARKNNFRPDPLVSTGSASLKDYSKSGYDKGHLCPAA